MILLLLLGWSLIFALPGGTVCVLCCAICPECSRFLPVEFLPAGTNSPPPCSHPVIFVWHFLPHLLYIEMPLHLRLHNHFCLLPVCFLYLPVSVFFCEAG